MYKLTIFLLLTTFDSFSQSRTDSINHTYFILGTLSDYNGRNFYSSIVDRVDCYYAFEKPLVNYIDSLLIADNIKHTRIMNRGGICINSKTLTKELNSLYNFRDDSTEINTKNNVWEKEYRGYLKDDIFNDSTKMYSFLLGAYLRYGKTLDTTSKIQMSNSITKSQACLKLLEAIGCSDLTVKILPHIPAQHIINFKPTEKLDSLIKYFEPLIQKQNSSWNLYRKQLLGKDYDTIDK